MAWRRCSKCLGIMFYESYEWAWVCLCCGRRAYRGGVLEAQPTPESTHVVSRPVLPVYVASPCASASS